MKIVSRLGSLAVFGLALLAGAAVQAEQVSFVTVGTFTGGDLAGTSEYLDAANGIDIVFSSPLNNPLNPPPSSVTTFGTFDTTGTTATSLTPVSSGFTLDIFQSTPTAGLGTFVGTLTGSLRIDNSQAFIVFDGPLTVTIGNVFYTIRSADLNNTPGTVALSPPTSNNGLATISGLVGINAVPEPASMAMLAMGGISVLAMRRRARLAN